MAIIAQRFALASRPVGEPSRDNFRLEKVEVPEPGPGQVLLRARYLSLDPYVRGRISGVRSYAEPTPIGSAPPGDAVNVVVKSEDPSLSVGDVVLADTGWQTYALGRGACSAQARSGGSSRHLSIVVVGCDIS